MVTNRDELPEYAIGPLLLRAQRHAADTFNAALAPLEIQGRHFGVLMTLDRFGPLSQVRLAQQLGADKSAMVRMVDDLESRGFVERGHDPTDRRAVAVTLTPAGADAFIRAESIAAATAERMLAGFSRDERARFRELLLRFAGG